MVELKIATWNVNSIRTRLETVLNWFDAHKVHVLCLQETKAQDGDFPKEAFTQSGYQVAFTGQKAYNGMAIVSRLPLGKVDFDFKGNPDSSQKRFMAATVGNVRLINVYFPNGFEVGSPQFAYKLDFISQLRRHLEKEFKPQDRLVVLGDFNVAPEARDVYDPVAMDGEILFHPDERASITKFKEWGLVDVFRLHHDEGGQYSWWDYRMNAFRRKIGLRIDHIWTTSILASRCTSCEIDKKPRTLPKPSDHAPAIAIFRL